MPQRGRITIGSLGNEIERRAETITHFKLRKFLHAAQASFRFDIVGEDKGEALPIRPALPVDGFSTGGLIDRPDIRIAFHDPRGADAPEYPAKTARNVGLHPEVGAGEDSVRAPCHGMGAGMNVLIGHRVFRVGKSAAEGDLLGVVTCCRSASRGHASGFC